MGLSREERIEQEQFFDKWIKSLPYKSLDLGKSKEDLLFDLYEKFRSGEINGAQDLLLTIFKTYYEQDKEQMRKFQGLSDLKIKHSLDLYKKFFSEALNVELCSNTMNGIFSALGEEITKALQNTFGNAIFIDQSENLKRYNQGMNTIIGQSLRNQGYFSPTKDCKLFINPTRKASESKFKRDDIVKRNFLSALKEYSSIYRFYDSKITPEKFDAIWKGIEFYFTEVRKNMSEELLQDEEVKKGLAEVEQLFKQTVSRTKRGLLKERQGNYYKKIKESYENIMSGNQSEQDSENIKEFMSRCKLLKKVLCITDEKGEPYKTHYFLVMPIEVATFYNLMTNFENSKKLSQEDTNLLKDLRDIMNGIFYSARTRGCTGLVMVDPTIEKFRGLNMNTSGINLSDPEVFKKFSSDVKSVINDFALPKTQECIVAICKDFLRGRYPVSEKALALVESEESIADQMYSKEANARVK